LLSKKGQKEFKTEKKYFHKTVFLVTFLLIILMLMDRMGIKITPINYYESYFIYMLILLGITTILQNRGLY